MDTWISRMCKQTSQRQLVVWIVLLALGVGTGVYFRRYLMDFARGPFNTTGTELRAIRDADSARHLFIRVAGEGVKDTGVYEETVETENGVEKSRYVSSRYFAMLVDHRFLVVKSPSTPPLNVAGALAPIPEDAAGRLFKGMTAQEVQERTYPFELDTDGFRTPGYWALAGAAVFLVLLLVYARPALVRFQDPEKHPVMQRVQKWGDPISVSAELEREVENPAGKRYSSCVFGENYLIDKSFFRVDVARFEDLVWAYKKIVKKRHYFIPVGTDYHAVMIFYGQSKEVKGKEKQVEEMLQFANQRAPWAVIGYSDKLAQMYKKQQAEFCGAVEARRRELKQQPSA